MKVHWKDVADEQQLVVLVDATRDAKPRDCYRVVLIAGQGLGDQAELQRHQVAALRGPLASVRGRMDRPIPPGWHRGTGPQAPAGHRAAA